MLTKFLFNPKYEQLINELGINELGNTINARELISIRDYSKTVLRVKPEEAAARAFRDLLILNKTIPIEQRLEKCFEMMNRFKMWHFDGKVNIDLHLGIRDSIVQLLRAYVGEPYENEFYAHLTRMGVKVPIEHDHLKSFAQIYLYSGKKSNRTSDHAAHDFFTDIIVKHSDKYSSCVTEEGQETLNALSAILYK